MNPRSGAALVLLAVALGVPPATAELERPAATPDDPSPRRIALLPFQNRSGGAAPLREIRDTLDLKLRQRGFTLLDSVELAEFMRRHRMRYTGGINRQLARSLRAETGAWAVLIVSLDLYQRQFPPKAALTCRLVTADDEPRIVWMDSAVRSGDQSPGLLNLGLIHGVEEIVEKVATELADSLQNREAPPSRRAERASYRRRSPGRFRPKVQYSSSGVPILPSGAERIVVLPFANDSTTRFTGKILTDLLVQHLVRAGAEVVEPGVVRQELLAARQIYPEGPSVPDIDLLRVELGADVVLYGEVADYKEGRTAMDTPMLDFNFRAVDASTRQVIWSSVSHSRGNQGVYFFDVGRIPSGYRLAREMAEALVTSMISTGR